MGLQKTSNSFHWLDYVILSLSLVMSCSVGIYFALSGGRQATTSEFLMGDRSLRLVPVSISLVASFLSAIMILGHPAEIYLNGIGFHFHLIGVFFAYVFAGAFFVSLLYPLRLTSAFEFLERRFQSKLVRCIATTFNLLSLTVYSGMAAFAPSTATEKVTANAARREHVIIACGVIGTFYTMIGGMKAVVWVDAIQASIMLSGTMAVAFKALVDCGGWQAMWQLNKDYGRLQIPSASLDPRERHTMWGMVVGIMFYWSSSLGVSQTSVQRYSALPTIRAARMSLALGLPGHCLMACMCTLAGMAIFGRYASVECDIFAAGWADTNQIVTYYVMERMHVPGFPGLFTAALFAAALSSVSSALGSASTIAWTDLLQPYVFKKVSETKATLIIKALVAAFGILTTIMAFLASQLGGTIIQACSAFVGAVAGPSMGLFLLGSLFPQANWFGASIGPLAGLAFGLWVCIGAYSIKTQLVQLPANVTGCDPFDPMTNTSIVVGKQMLAGAANATSTVAAHAKGFLAEYIYSISYVWTPAIGVSVTIVVGLLLSFLAERGRYFGFVEPIEVHEQYLMPGIGRLWRACGCCGRVRVASREDEASWENGTVQSQLSIPGNPAKRDSGVRPHSPRRVFSMSTEF